MLEFDLPKRIAFITAHPDDETEISAGTIYLNTQKGGQNFLFCATLGEKGKAYLTEDLTEVALGKLRQQELEQVGSFLGIDKIRTSNFSDGRVENELDRLEIEIRQFIDETNPELVVSFGPDGYSGHRDHIAIYKALQGILKANPQFDFVQFAGPSDIDCPGYTDCLLSKRKSGSYVALQRLVPNIRISINPEIKKQALALYKTQYAGLNPCNVFPKDIADHLLNYEYFYRD